jgi:hypothetical protein
MRQRIPKRHALCENFPAGNVHLDARHEQEPLRRSLGRSPFQTPLHSRILDDSIHVARLTSISPGAAWQRSHLSCQLYVQSLRR